MQRELERYSVIMTEEALMEITPAARQGLLADAKNEAMKAKEVGRSAHSLRHHCFSFLSGVL